MPGTTGNGAGGSNENCSMGEMFTRDGREHSLVVVVTLLLSLSRLPEHQFFWCSGLYYGSIKC